MSKKSHSGKKKISFGRRVLTLVFMVVLILAVVIYFASKRLSADSLPPSECVSGSYSLSQKAYLVQVKDDKGNPVADKTVKVLTSYLIDAGGNANNQITQMNTNAKGEAEIRIPYCTASQGVGTTKFYLGKDNMVFGDLVFQVEGYADKIIRNSKFQNGFSADEYKKFIAIKNGMETVAFRNSSTGNTSNSVTTNPSVPTDPAQLTPTISLWGGNTGAVSTAVDQATQKEITVTFVGWKKNQSTGKWYSSMVRNIPIAQVETKLYKQTEKKKTKYWMFYNNDFVVSKIFLLNKTDNTVITSMKISTAYVAKDDQQATKYFTKQIDNLKNIAKKYQDKKNSQNKINTTNSNVNSSSSSNTNSSGLNSNTALAPKKVQSWKDKIKLNFSSLSSIFKF